MPCRNPVRDQQGRLARDRCEDPVRRCGLAPADDRPHAEVPEHVRRPATRFGVSGEFHKGEQVDRVVRAGDDGRMCVRLAALRSCSGDDRAPLGKPGKGGKVASPRVAPDIADLHPGRACRSRRGGSGEGQATLGRKRPVVERREGAPRVRQNAGEPVSRRRFGIEGGDVPAVQQEPRAPAAADDVAADDRGPSHPFPPEPWRGHR